MKDIFLFLFCICVVFAIKVLNCGCDVVSETPKTMTLWLQSRSRAAI